MPLNGHLRTDTLSGVGCSRGEGRYQMQVVVAGLNHETAPVAVREMAAISLKALPSALRALRALPGVDEAAILSTCNRTELYAVVGQDLTRAALCDFLPAFHGFSPDLLDHRMYLHEGREGVTHLCLVASGLDSAVLGETQVLAQVKEAYQAASENGTIGPLLHELFKRCIATAKQVHTETAVGIQPLSMGSVALQMIRKVFHRMGNLQVLVLGTGKMGRVAIRHLAEAGVGSIIVASHSPERARQLAGEVHARHIGIEDVHKTLPKVRVVIAATTGMVLSVAEVRAALSVTESPLVIVDLGVPRNVDPTVAKLPQVMLFDVDDIKRIAETNLQSRRQELDRARNLAESCAERYMGWVASRTVVPLIRSLTEEAERIRQQELNRARVVAETTDDQWAAVEQLAHSLSRRIMHECIMRLKSSVHGA